MEDWGLECREGGPGIWIVTTPLTRQAREALESYLFLATDDDKGLRHPSLQRALNLLVSESGDRIRLFRERYPSVLVDGICSAPRRMGGPR